MFVVYSTFSIEYIFQGYLKHGSVYKQSCFFMPCAPQSIAEFDQTLGLVVGLFVLVVLEGVLPYRRWRKKKKKEQRAFEQEIDERVEMSRLEGNVLDV